MELKFIFLCDDTGLEECVDFCREHQKSLKNATILVPLEYIGLFKSINRSIRFVALPLKGQKAWSIVSAMVAMQEVAAVALIVDADTFSSLSVHANALISVCRQMGVGCFLDKYGCYGMLEYVQEHNEDQEKRRQEEVLRKKQEAAERERFLKEQMIQKQPIYWFDEEERKGSEPLAVASGSNPSKAALLVPQESVEINVDKMPVDGELSLAQKEQENESADRQVVSDGDVVNMVDSAPVEQSMEPADQSSTVVGNTEGREDQIEGDVEHEHESESEKQENSKRRSMRSFKPRKKRR